MLKLIGFIGGLGLAVFIVQPWAAEHYPELYQSGKQATDSVIAELSFDNNITAVTTDDSIEVLNTDSIQAVPPETTQPETIVVLNQAPAIVLRQPIWSAFKQEVSARAFARKIQQKTRITIIIEQNSNSHYQLILEADSDIAMQQQIVKIEQATGLIFSAQQTGNIAVGVR